MNYRHFYKKHHGSIPKDINGRSFDIHHHDGNRSNNCIENLKAVSIQEHFDIHYVQGDWQACHALTIRMKKSPEEISELSRRANLEKVQAGIHHMLGGDFARDLVKKGVHNFLGGSIQGACNIRRGDDGRQKEIVARTMLNRKHVSQQRHKCPHCQKEGKGGIMKRWHFDKCKDKK